MENEHQLSACTDPCTLPDTASVFCILESSYVGGSGESSRWILRSTSYFYQTEQWASCPADSPNTSSQRGTLASPMWCGLGGWQLDDL